MSAFCFTTHGALTLLIMCVTLVALTGEVSSLYVHVGPVYFDAADARVQIIQPGTKWCGMGDVAKGDDDFGRYEQVDACCQAHDKCPDCIEAGEEKHGLVNDHHIVMSHCDCDQQLYNCLKSVNSTERENKAAERVGNEYFNDLRMQCFNFTQPAACVSEETRRERVSLIRLRRTKCIKYEYSNEDETWQWFDVPFF